jgi:DNA-binding response OmpR family regulator
LNRYLCETIRARGHDVRSTKTRDEAIAAVEQHDYDIVVCDLILPDGTGHDVARLAQERGIKTLRITGHPDEFATMRKTGVRCLYKPFGSDQLFAALYAEIKADLPARRKSN